MLPGIPLVQRQHKTTSQIAYQNERLQKATKRKKGVAPDNVSLAGRRASHFPSVMRQSSLKTASAWGEARIAYWKGKERKKEAV